MRRRSPRPIAAALQSLGAELAPQSLLARTQAAWADAVGALSAAHSEPATERSGVVTVLCDEAVWTSELHMQATQLLEALNARLAPGETVSELRFRTR